MTKRKSSVILPVALIVMSICLILGTTLAYFTDTRGTSTPVNFGKIEISVDEPFSSTVSIKDAIPGTKITDKVAFKKAVDSEDMYVRAKVLFTTTSEDTNIQNLVTELNTYELDIKEYLAGDYAWSDKYGDYIYLVERETPTNAYNITTTQEIVVSDRIELPRELRQSANYVQYFQSINLLIELQAIQSYNVSKTLTEVDRAIGEIYNGFGMEQPSEYTDPKYFKFNGNTVTGLTKEGKLLTEIAIPSSYGIQRTETKYEFNSREEMDEYGMSLDDMADLEAFWNWQEKVGAWDHVFQPDSSLTYTVQEQMYTYGDIPVTSISDSAFSNCTAIKSVTIPDSVTRIGRYAFSGASSLETIRIPNSVKFIGDGAFSSCSELKSITIPDNVITIGGSTFHNCIKLTSVTIPDSVTSIGYNSFYGCTGLQKTDGNLVYISTTDNQYFALLSTTDTNITSATVKENCKFILGNAFRDCADLTSITIPDSVMSIDSGVFDGCTKLQKTDGNLVYISTTDNQHFALYSVTNSNEQSITINENCRFILDGAVSSYTNLKSVTIPDNVVEIGSSAFWQCTNLENVTIGKGVTSLCNGAFCACPNLSSIIIPDSVIYIGPSAFSACTSLNSVSIGENVAYIYSSSIAFAFANCPLLANIAVDPLNKVYDSRNVCNAIIETATNTLVLGSENTIIPDSVTSIGDSAFPRCSPMNIVIPNSVTSIGVNAFQYCSGLKSVIISNSVTRIGNSAFYDCKNLKSVTFEEGVRLESVGDQVFYNCTSLNYVSFESGAVIESVGSSIFYNCTNAYVFCENSDVKSVLSGKGVADNKILIKVIDTDVNIALSEDSVVWSVATSGNNDVMTTTYNEVSYYKIAGQDVFYSA